MDKYESFGEWKEEFTDDRATCCYVWLGEAKLKVAGLKMLVFSMWVTRKDGIRN